jgi:LAO/AO transport system kinase
MTDALALPIDAVVAALASGDRSVVAACLNDVEDQRPAARHRASVLMKAISRARVTERALRVGITGPPGVGKSSLVSALIAELRAAKTPRSVGVLAVDPSSRRSGGALLGDRIRIARSGDDPDVFIRSLATRGDLGGLARAVASDVVILSVAFDVVMVETVGVGQSETDVRDVVDTLLFVLQPGAGDTLQHLKAGIMETPDIFVVNKADLGSAAEQTRAELHAALHSLVGVGALLAQPPVVMTSARDGTGVSDLALALDTAHAALVQTGERDRRRREGALALATREFARRYGELGVERAGGAVAVRHALSLQQAREDAVFAIDALNPFEDDSARGGET